MKQPQFIITVYLTVLLGAVTPQTPTARPTQQELVSKGIAAMLELGREINPDSLVYGEALRRELAGQNIVALIHACLPPQTFQRQIDEGCSALREQWPWIAEQFFVCAN